MTYRTLSNPSRFARFPDLGPENFPVISNTVLAMIREGVNPATLRAKPVDPISVSLACGKVKKFRMADFSICILMNLFWRFLKLSIVEI